jgi:hypothetical protein
VEVTLTAGTSPYPESAPSAPAATAGGWTSSDLVIGTSLIVLLVALFMPWFSGTVQLGGQGSIPGSVDGPRAHGYLWFVFALAIVALAVLVARDAIGRVPGNLPSAAQLLMVATGLALLLTLLGLVIRPSAGLDVVSQVSTVASFPPQFMVSIGWSYGGFVAVIAAAAAFAAAVRQAGSLTSARGVLRARRRHSGATG